MQCASRRNSTNTKEPRIAAVAANDGDGGPGTGWNRHDGLVVFEDVMDVMAEGRLESGVVMRSRMWVAPRDLRNASFFKDAVVMMGECPESFATWMAGMRNNES